MQCPSVLPCTIVIGITLDCSPTRRVGLSLALVFLGLLCSAACGSDSNAATEGDAALDEVDASSSAPERCTDEDNQKIFVVGTNLNGSESHLYRFDPAELTYTHIGQLSCPGSRIISMAVDRNGTGWATSYDGSLSQIDTQDASCAATGMETGQHSIGNFGMGYATVGDTEEEKLYITATGGWYGPPGEPYRKLAAIDTDSLLIDMVGNLEAPTPANMELTGTGDGRLFGMIVDVRDLSNLIISVDQLNPDTGATIATKIVPLDAKSGFAFAHWGGDFWLFTGAPDGKARVLQFDFDNGAVVQTVDVELGFPGTIVGAGVSTCAPIRID